MKQEEKAVVLLDMFTKNFCINRKEYNKTGELKFRCEECPFQHDTEKAKGVCMVKEFKCKFAPGYVDFGSMGDL